MPNVVRFTLSTARNLDVPGAGAFHSGVLDVDANDARLLALTRYKVQAYGAVEVGIVDAATPFPLLPSVPVEPTPDPYPQYLTEVEVGEEYVRWDQIDPAEPIIGVVDGDLATIGNKTVRRDAAGYAAFIDVGAVNHPSQPYHLTRMDYVEGKFSYGIAVDKAPLRGGDGFISVAGVTGVTVDPFHPDHLARKGYVDAIGTDSATGDTVVRRNSGGNFDANIIYLTGWPTVAEHAAPKGYVDGRGRSPINGAIGNDYTPVLADEHRTLWFDTTSGARTLTLPTNAAVPLPDGSWFDVVNATGTNSVTVAAGAGGTFQHAPGDEVLTGQFAHARLIKLSAEQWYLVRLGDVVDPITSIGSTPTRTGKIAIVAGVAYISVGTSSSADWKQITN